MVFYVIQYSVVLAFTIWNLHYTFILKICMQEIKLLKVVITMYCEGLETMEKCFHAFPIGIIH
jgi:hypothetical protein